ncbi:MAG: Wzz/FepE/Etk N-terminal domain-containing protein [Candidatus Krumholzibacteria bacterium]|nr:Wzz/FepE/Etk N-terminal domain-containing protein [Candidatus Krumholzibacteria bacterium]
MSFRHVDLIIRYRRAVAVATCVFALAALFYALFADPVYTSRALLMPPAEDGGEGLLSAWMASLSLPSMLAPQTSGSTTAAVMVDILGSRALAEAVIDSLSLTEWYGADTIDDAVRRLRGETYFVASQTGMISLKANDRDPATAQAIALAYIAGLDSLNRSLQFSRAEATMRFTSAQIDTFRRRLDRSRERLAAFQSEHGIIDFDEQVRGAIDIAATLKVRSSIVAIERDMLRGFAFEDMQELRRKELELENINRQIESLMDGGGGSTVFLPLRELPALYQEYASLQRDLEVDQRVYSFLLEKHEESGIERARTTPSVQIVDPPNLPARRSGIPRWAIVLVAALVGALWMSAVLLWWSWLGARARDPQDEAAMQRVVETVKDDARALRRRLRI